MQTHQSKLIRQQLDAKLQKLKSQQIIFALPQKGWIHVLRNSLGMSLRQLADRLQVTKARVNQIEKDEISHGLTLKTLHHVAEALDCTFVYAFIPHSSLDHMVHAQAKKVAKAQLQRVSHTMGLENQQLSKAEQEEILKHEIEKLESTIPRTLWDSL